MTSATRRKIKNTASCYLMGVWPMVGFVLFSVAPLLISCYTGFTELIGYNIKYAEWVGFDNYVRMFHEPLFFKAVVNTLYSLLSVPINLAVGLLVAMAMSAKRIRGKKIIRIVFFIPYLCSTAVVANTFIGLFDQNFGAINTILRKLGFKKQMFFMSEKSFMPLMFLLLAWSNMGYYSLLFYAAITGVPKEVTEAAEIDGAGSVTQFFKITMPLITPTTFYLFTTGLISALQLFAPFQIISQSLNTALGSPYGPGNAGTTIVYYIYMMSWGEGQASFGIGYGSAVAWVFALVIILLTVLNFKLSKKWVHYD